MKILFLVSFWLIAAFLVGCKKSASTSDQLTVNQELNILKNSNWIEDSLTNLADGFSFRMIQPSYLHIDTALHYAFLQNLPNGESDYDTGQIVFQGISLQLNSVGSHYLSSFSPIEFKVRQNSLLFVASVGGNSTDNFYFHK
jgi:hypothetical protein